MSQLLDLSQAHGLSYLVSRVSEEAQKSKSKQHVEQAATAVGTQRHGSLDSSHVHPTRVALLKWFEMPLEGYRPRASGDREMQVQYDIFLQSRIVLFRCWIPLCGKERANSLSQPPNEANFGQPEHPTVHDRGTHSDGRRWCCWVHWFHTLGAVLDGQIPARKGTQPTTAQRQWLGIDHSLPSGARIKLRTRLGGRHCRFFLS